LGYKGNSLGFGLEGRLHCDPLVDLEAWGGTLE
jgi:hypothetical protein